MDSPVTVTRLQSRDPNPPQDGIPVHHVGHPKRSHFKNPWPSAGTPATLSKIISTRFSKARNFIPVPTDRSQLVKVSEPTWGYDEKGFEKKLKATWIGHASWFVETSTRKRNGIGILFDPVFSERTSPFQFIGPKRYTPVPCSVSELPDCLRVVVISHNHYDHLDYSTIKDLWAKSQGIHFFCPLGIKAWFLSLSIGIESSNVTELDWWESVRVDVEGSGSIILTCTPSQHFSIRGISDRDQTLWSSWALEESNDSNTERNAAKRLWFAGDTGYRAVDTPNPSKELEASLPVCPAFKDIGEVFGGFDLALLPIGLYSPRDHMSPIHCAPEDSVLIHKDIKAKKSIGMHYGTVRGGLSQYFEDVKEPPKRFQQAAMEVGLRWGEDVFLIGVGDTFFV